jgi:DNA-binding response OmpR family regulator
VPEAKATILVVEDDLDVADMLSAYFNVQGYDVLTANWGEDAIRVCTDKLPDLILLDIRLPDIDGYEVARQLRAGRKTKDIPIIFLTEKRARADRLKGLTIGGDDYITKPFDIQELRLRVRNALTRANEGTFTNPVTNLPEGLLVDEKLAGCLNRKDWAILSVSIENLDKFREDYGFVASDDVLRALKLMIQNALREAGTPDDFLGQLEGTTFILVTSQQALPELHERIRSRLEQSLDYFYPLKDRDQPQDDRQNLRIRYTQVTPDQGPFKDLGQIRTLLRKRDRRE